MHVLGVYPFGDNGEMGFEPTNIDVSLAYGTQLCTVIEAP